jgi:hypothetical protein
MICMTTENKADIESLKLSDLTVAQFRQVMRECLGEKRSPVSDRAREMAMLQTLGIKNLNPQTW